MSGKLEGIQVARGIAALGVLLFHSNLMIREIPDSEKVIIPFVYQYGAMGVQLFFVISGFIIAYVLQKEEFRLGQFLAKRVVRIYPIYIVATLVALYFHLDWRIAFHNSAEPEFLLKSMALIPQETSPFFQPGWTLVHEMIFYIIAAALFPIFGIKGVMVIMATTGALGLTFYMLEVKVWTYEVVSFYNLYFAAGIALAVYRQKLARVHWAAALAVAIAAMAIYVQAHSFAPAYHINWVARTAHYLVACSALCVALLNLPPIENRLWNLLVFMGTISFSIYLVHWIVIRLTIRARIIFGLNDYPELVRWGGIFISIAGAAIVWALIENPTNNLGRRIVASSQKLRAPYAASKEKRSS